MRDRFSHFLRQERRQRGWSQQDLAEKLKATRITITRWESGTNTPSLHWRRKICELFHQQIEELFPETFFPLDAMAHAHSHAFSSKTEKDNLQTSEIFQSQASRQEESTTQHINAKISRLEMNERHLELQKKFIEYTIDVANKMIIDVLDPQCDVKTRSYAIEELLLNHQYTDEVNEQEILLPTMDDVRKALDIAKQATRHIENYKETPNIVKPVTRHVESRKETSGVVEQATRHVEDRKGTLETATKNQGYKHTLVATLGDEPQIVTLTLDLLLKRGIPIYEVIVLHPAASPRIQQSLKRLSAEFVRDCYTFEGHSRTIHFRQQVLSHYGDVIDDIVDETTASGAIDTIGELIRSLKQQQRIIHFSISGGHRLMTFLSFSPALLYFETPDELLHLYVPEYINESANKSGAMHIEPGDGRRLIEVPFARAAQPFLNRMLNYTPSNTIKTQREEQKAEEQQRCRKVVNALTSGRARGVLQAIAQGLHPSEVADALHLEQATISHYTAKIYRECRNVWDVPESTRVDYRFVQAKFANYSYSG